MKLKLKVPLAVFFTLILSSAVAAIVFQTFVLEQFRVLEDEQVHRNIGRVQETFQGELRNLSTLAQDWAIWDELAHYIQAKVPEFENNNLGYAPLQLLAVSQVVLLNPQRSPIYSAEVDTESKRIVDPPPALWQSILASGILDQLTSHPENSNNIEQASVKSGLLRMGEKNYLLSVALIVPANKNGEEHAHAGYLAFTREVNDQVMARISQQTKLGVRAVSVTGRPATAVTSARAESALFMSPDVSFTSDLLDVNLTALDILGKPILQLHFNTPRDIFEKGLAMRTFLTAVLLALSLVTATLVIILLNRLILNPLATLVKSLREISDTADFHSRVPHGSHDELGHLGRTINTTLQTLQEVIDQAEDAQHRAESANLAKSSFIAKVSHELRTPIHSITGMLRILLREERASAKRNYIMMARNAAYGLLETINEILDFSKAEAGKLALERIEFSLHATVREAIQTVGPRIEEKGSLEAIVEIPQGLPDKVYGDPLRLRQVLVNLLGNATKFTKEGHVGLSVAIFEQSAERILLQFTVFDTGVGIPADRLEHIFEPFGQADESVSRMFTGTGLGLTIVKQFVQGMGGSVRVESQVGVGSRFILTVPFDCVEGAVPVIAKLNLTSPRIALLDGESVVVRRFAQELKAWGYVPQITHCGKSDEVAILAQSLNEYGLIIATSEAIKRSQVFDLIVDVSGRKTLPIVAVLSPFEISVRERLLALEVPFVVTRPSSLIDILGAVTGATAFSSDRWEDAEEWSLQAARPLEVLVADDAPTNRIILTELLRDAGHNVICVENGLEMVARVKDSLRGAPGTPAFDIILTDVQMPLLDGLNATSQIRSLEKEFGVKTALPIVAVTAHAMTDETSRMRSFGVNDVVTKPLDPLKLGQVMQRLTGHISPAGGQTSPATNAEKNVSEAQLSEIGLTAWRKLAKRDDAVPQLFGLTVDQTGPEDFQLVLDLADVLERTGNSVRRSLLIFRGFLECFRDQLQRLNDAKQSKNTEELRFASHALKGLLLDIGARASSTLASSIEQMCKSGEGAQGFGLVGQLTRQVLLISRLVSQIEQVASGSKAVQEEQVSVDPQSEIAELLERK